MIYRTAWLLATLSYYRGRSFQPAERTASYMTVEPWGEKHGSVPESRPKQVKWDQRRLSYTGDTVSAAFYVTIVSHSGCVVECRICNREVAGSNLSLGYFAPRSTQPSIPLGSVNEYQLRLGRQRQIWLIPIADERVGVQIKLKSLENTCHIWALLRWWFTTKRRYIKCMHLTYITYRWCPAYYFYLFQFNSRYKAHETKREENIIK